MDNLQVTFDNMIWNLTHRLSVKDIVDILIMSVIIYELLVLVRRTRSSALLKGAFVLLLFVLISTLFGLTSLNWLLTNILNNGAIVLVILFQPEIRKALEHMGRNSLIHHRGTASAENIQERNITAIIQTLSDLSRRRVGALIVIENRTGLQDVIDTGTQIDAEISAPLLENIFEPKTPLHDGAVVIRDGRVQAAACILPLTEARGVSLELGTRHRAAIGISEGTDATVLVVSEETGTISIAEGGRLSRKLNTDAIRMILEKIFQTEEGKLSAFLHSLRIGRKEIKE